MGRWTQCVQEAGQLLLCEQPPGICHGAAYIQLQTDVQEAGHCFFWGHRFFSRDTKKMGYSSWEALWKDYTVFGLARNPYDRAASSYEYMYSERRVRSTVFVCTWFLSGSACRICVAAASECVVRCACAR